MPAYNALVQRLFTQDANVRNVRAFFSVKRAKFEPALDLNQAATVVAPLRLSTVCPSCGHSHPLHEGGAVRRHG